MRCMKYLTVRNLPPDVAEALEREKRARGRSLNQVVVELLQQTLGLSPAAPRNGLRRYAGTWSDEEHRQLEAAVATLQHVDEEIWR